jgi:hypothetical protein
VKLLIQVLKHFLHRSRVFSRGIIHFETNTQIVIARNLTKVRLIPVLERLVTHGVREVYEHSYTTMPVMMLLRELGDWRANALLSFGKSDEVSCPTNLRCTSS